MSAGKKNSEDTNRALINYIIRHPDMSDKEIAKKLGTYRERIWRIRKKMIDSNQIWGYSYIIDENALGRHSYKLFIKFSNISEEVLDTILELISEKVQKKYDIMMKHCFYINSEYDIILTFSTEKRPDASRFYEYAKKQLGPHLAEELKMIDIALCLVNDGFINPNIKEIYKVVPD